MGMCRACAFSVERLRQVVCACNAKANTLNTVREIVDLVGRAVGAREQLVLESSGCRKSTVHCSQIV